MSLINLLRTTITTVSGTATTYDRIGLLRQLVTAYGGSPTKWTATGLLREAVAARGGAPTQHTSVGLLRELITARGGTPAAFTERALLAQLVGLGPLATSFDPATLFASSEQGAWWDPSDLSTMSQDSAGTTPASVGQPVGRITDKSGRGNHFTQPTTSFKPILRNSGSLYWLEFDGFDDHLICSGSFAGMATGSNLLMAVQVPTSDGNAILFNHATGTPFFGCMAPGDGGVAHSAAGSVTYTVNRVPTANDQRGTLHTAVTGATAKVLSASNIDFTGFTTPHFSSFAGWEVTGNLYGIIAHDGLSGAQITNAETYLAGKAGITL